jgi:spore germination protein YaaH/flagellar hook assembly protein FlgD
MRTIAPMTARHPLIRHARPAHAGSRHALAIVTGLLVLVGVTPIGTVTAAAPAGQSSVPGSEGAVRRTIQYEEAMAHAADTTAFAPGARVTVPFTPRRTDRWLVGGVQPQALPTGRLSGTAMRATRPAIGRAGNTRMTTASGPSSGPIGAADLPYLDPADTVFGEPAAAVDAGALKREVFGFLPYWELSDPSTRLDWQKLSTIAYFGVGAAANGDLQKRTSDGSTSVGWSGWTSSKMTSVMNAAHASGARVVLTVQSFAWSSTGVSRQKALLGSAANRANLARQIAAAVRDRGADGVNLDFEPIVATYADEFTALVRSVRSELNKVHAGYQLTFDTTGWIGNYPIEKGTAAGAADAVVIMGYDYRGSSSNPVGSVAPIGGPAYDITDTLASYVSRVPAAKVILGVPYYGRAWSTDSSALHARNISGTKYGASTTVVYGTARQYAADHGKKWDSVEGSAWVVYKRQNCTAKYGCVTPYRQIYFDDAKALGLKYDLVNRYNLRGAGIWALGYDGTRTELYQVLKDKFITDKIPPRITGSSLSSPVISPNGDGRKDTTTVTVAVTGQIGFGWLVEPFFDGIPGRPVRSGNAPLKLVSYTWNGRTGAGVAVPDGPYRITVWFADASNNRASVQKVVTVDRRPAAVSLSVSSPFLSPNGDRHSDTATVVMRADEALTGTIRVNDKNGTTVRKWAFAATTGRSWTWDGRDAAGRTVADGRYTIRVGGYDRAGNPTIRAVSVHVDRTIRSLTWAHASFVPRAGGRDRLTFVLRRHATVTVAIYQGTTLVRRIWTGRSLAAGTYGWTWSGKTASGAYVKSGTYRVVVDATSWVGASRFSRNVTVKAP